MWCTFSCAIFTACFHAQTEGPKGQFAVEQLRIVEVLPPNLFGKEFPHVFQVRWLAIMHDISLQYLFYGNKWIDLCISYRCVMSQFTVGYHVKCMKLSESLPWFRYWVPVVMVRIFPLSLLSCGRTRSSLLRLIVAMGMGTRYNVGRIFFTHTTCGYTTFIVCVKEKKANIYSLPKDIRTHYLVQGCHH